MKLQVIISDETTSIFSRRMVDITADRDYKNIYRAHVMSDPEFVVYVAVDHHGIYGPWMMWAEVLSRKGNLDMCLLARARIPKGNRQRDIDDFEIVMDAKAGDTRANLHLLLFAILEEVQKFHMTKGQ